eukprot:scaffold60636_cov28-Tisochrysis_lutea.AAC.1
MARAGALGYWHRNYVLRPRSSTCQCVLSMYALLKNYFMSLHTQIWLFRKRNEFLLKVATGFLGESALCVTFFASTLHLGRNTGASKWEGACGIFLKGRVDKLSRNVACACEGLRPEVRVGHFTIYGGGYYSYLYARCLSSAIWTDLLAQDPLDKGAGLVPDLLSSQSAGVALAPASVT